MFDDTDFEENENNMLPGKIRNSNVRILKKISVLCGNTYEQK
jgi:hypothetical protein